MRQREATARFGMVFRFALVCLAFLFANNSTYGAVITITPDAEQNASYLSSVGGNNNFEFDPGPGLLTKQVSVKFSPQTGVFLFAIDFDLSSIGSAPISNAVLNVLETVETDPASFSLTASQGTGSISESSFFPPTGNGLSLSVTGGNITIQPHPASSVVYDLTSAIQLAQMNGWQHLSLLGRASGGHFLGGFSLGYVPATVTWAGNGTLPEPQLVVTIPEPSAASLALIGFLVSYVITRRPDVNS